MKVGSAQVGLVPGAVQCNSRSDMGQNSLQFCEDTEGPSWSPTLFSVINNAGSLWLVILKGGAGPKYIKKTSVEKQWLPVRLKARLVDGKCNFIKCP